MIRNSELMKGIAPTVVLNLLKQRAMYGYEIIRRVNEITGGEFQWREGALYPCLHKMEAAGLLKSEWIISAGKPRKYYSLTPAGTEQAVLKAEESKNFCNALNLLLNFQ